MTIFAFLPPRSALFLPASNPRAIIKARGLPADMIILDLEDAVKPDAKDAARAAAVVAANEGFGSRICAIRINAFDSEEHEADCVAVAGSAADCIVIPKVECAQRLATTARLIGKPVVAMIETPRAVIDAALLAGVNGVIGLLAGTNDLSSALGLPKDSGREGLTLALQTIVLGGRAHNRWVLDGVFNALDDPQGLARECDTARRFGFDGKTLIHPGQIDIANAAFSPSAADIEDARALIAAATGGAERFRDRMIETMHVDAARRLLARAVHSGDAA